MWNSGIKASTGDTLDIACTGAASLGSRPYDSDGTFIESSGDDLTVGNDLDAYFKVAAN